MPPCDPNAPFDVSRFTPQELAAVRFVVHAASPERFAGVAPDGPFDVSLYTPEELAVMRELTVALRQPRPAGAQSVMLNAPAVDSVLSYGPPPGQNH